MILRQRKEKSRWVCLWHTASALRHCDDVERARPILSDTDTGQAPKSRAASARLGRLQCIAARAGSIASSARFLIFFKNRAMRDVKVSRQISNTCN